MFGLALAGLAGAASADELRLDARSGAPVIEAEINGRPVRLIVDTTMPALAALDRQAAARLGLTRLPPFMSAVMELDGERALRGRLARPQVRFPDGQSSRVITALFNTEVEGADGAIGPGALPYDSIEIVLADGLAPVRSVVIGLESFDHWVWPEDLAQEPARIALDLGRAETLLARRLTRAFVDRGLLSPAGEVRRAPFRLGVSMNAQSMSPSVGFSVSGFALAETVCHTDEVLYRVEAEDNAIVVYGGESRRAPFLFLGRSALAGCSRVLASRAQRRLTLACE